MTLSTIAAGVIIVCATALMNIVDKDYDEKKQVFEKEKEKEN